MATATLGELMDEMAEILRDTLAAGVDQVTSRLNLNPSGLSIDIYPGDPFRTEDAAGFGDANGASQFTVRARLDLADIDASQDALLALMDDEHDLSLANALYDDQSLNGLATSVKVDGPTGFIPYTDSPGMKVGVEWGVTVLRASS